MLTNEDRVNNLPALDVDLYQVVSGLGDEPQNWDVLYTYLQMRIELLKTQQAYIGK